MTDELRDRLRDLAGEMPTLHPPEDLSGRVRRRGMMVVATVSAIVLLVAMAGWAGVRAVSRTDDQVPITEPNPFPTVGDRIPASDALLEAPEAMVFDSAGNLYVSEYYGNKVDVIAPDGSLAVIAGTGLPGYEGDGGPATAAVLDSAAGVAFDAAHDLLVVDNGNSCIRKIARSGAISTIAGRCGDQGFSGDGGPALDAQMSRPIGVALDPEGGFFFTDNDFGLLRHVDERGTVITVAGGGTVSPLVAGSDGVPAFTLDLGRTSYVLRDGDGNLYVTDLALHIVVKIDSEGVATVVAGTGAPGFSGDGGLAVRARLDSPSGLAMDALGNLYVSDTNNDRIRMIDPDGVITTIAGTVEGQAGDGGVATDAQLFAPAGLAFDAEGRLYVADQGNDRVRRIDTAGVITTIAGA
jgi:sugar lactone lactonase YvrE